MSLYSSRLELFRKVVEMMGEASESKPLSGSPTPYSLLSYEVFKSEAAFRQVIENEICEMALPVLLDKGVHFLEAAQKRTALLKSGGELERLAEKIRCLDSSKYLQNLRKIPGGYGFVSYPGYLLVDPVALVERFPGDTQSFFEWAYPVVYEVEGLAREGKPVPGWMAFYFIKPAGMRQQVDTVRRKTTEAVLALERLNAKIVGLGGLSASLTEGGKILAGQTGKSAVTTGHNYTVANMLNTLQIAAEARKMPLSGAVVAVIGAAGSVGSGLVKSLAALGQAKKIILIDKRPIENVTAGMRVGSIREDISEADFVLLATSSSELLFEPSQLKHGAIVVDDSQPKNISENVLKERPDVLVLEGGAVTPPKGQYAIRRAFGPRLKEFSWRHINNPLAGRDEIPCCFAEAMLWAAAGESRENYSLGKPDSALIEFLNKKGKALGFGPGAPQSYGKIYSPERLAPPDGLVAFDPHNPEQLEAIAWLHAALLPDSPISKLGGQFMKRFYYKKLTEEGLIRCDLFRVNGKYVAFSSYTDYPHTFMERGKKRHWLYLSFLMTGLLLARPSRIGVVWNVMRQTRLRGQASDNGVSGEYLSLGVLPDHASFRDSKTGARIPNIMFEKVIDYFKSKKFKEILLMIKKNNKKSQLFYHSYGAAIKESRFILEDCTLKAVRVEE